MGSQTKYGKKDLVYVAINLPPAGEGGAPGDPIKYGFFTNIPTANRTDLGQIAIPESSFADPPDKLVIGCSFPKPRRASRRENLRYTSSFVARDRLDEARKKGYRVSPSKGNSKINLAASSLVQSVYVVIRGIKYGWNMPKVTETNAGSLAELGVIKAVAGDRDELCFGCNFPKPPKASLVKVTGDDIKTITTFYDPGKTLEKWTPKGGGRLSI
jgi:hypothetical protein